MDTFENQKLEIEDLIPRFPHLMEQILQKLDNESLVKGRKVARIWQQFIDQKNYPWVRIVRIPAILNEDNTYLHLAAVHNQIDMFEVILYSEADRNVVNYDGYSPFHIACLLGNVRIAELFLKESEELEVDLNITTVFPPIAVLELTCKSANSESTEKIMKNSDEMNIQLKKMRGNLKLNKMRPFSIRNFGMRGFLYACRDGNLEIVEFLMKYSTSMNIDLNTLNVYNISALHLACYWGHEEVAKRLIEESTKLNLNLNTQDTWGYTAFHVACKFGRTHIVKIMLDHSESMSLSFSLKTHRSAQTGFHFACHAGHDKIVIMLMEKSKFLKLDLASKNRWGKTGLRLHCDFLRKDLDNILKKKTHADLVKRSKDKVTLMPHPHS